jgi:hypothetical protein
MDWSLSHLLVGLVVPAALVYKRRRAATPIAAATLATWLLTTAAILWFDSDDPQMMLLYLFVGLPAFVVGVGMFAATRFAPTPRLWFDAGFLAVVGWWLGLVVLILMPPMGAHGEWWSVATFIAPPAMYAGAGAGFGATNPPIR